MNKVIQEMEVVKAALATTDGMAATINGHIKELDKNKSAHDEITKEFERVRKSY